jgi:hypothetical protein
LQWTLLLLQLGLLKKKCVQAVWHSLPWFLPVELNLHSCWAAKDTVMCADIFLKNQHMSTSWWTSLVLCRKIKMHTGRSLNHAFGRARTFHTGLVQNS